MKEGAYIDHDRDGYFASVATALREVAGMLSPEQLVALAVPPEQH
jgi:hypothetical protein